MGKVNLLFTTIGQMVVLYNSHSPNICHRSHESRMVRFQPPQVTDAGPFVRWICSPGTWVQKKAVKREESNAILRGKESDGSNHGWKTPLRPGSILTMESSHPRCAHPKPKHSAKKL